MPDLIVSCYMLHHRPFIINMSLAELSACTLVSLLIWVRVSDGGFKVSFKIKNR